MAKVDLKRAVALLAGITLASLILEVFLQIYNPFPSTIKRGQVVLRTNSRTVFINPDNPKLSPTITISTNSLGFRGPEPPLHSRPALRIVTVGGSTTHSFYNTDGWTWPELLARQLERRLSGTEIWVNNAGLSGHSTFGHLLLLQQYLVELHPHVIIFLVGVNDIGRTQPDEFALFDAQAIQQNTTTRIKAFLLRHSEAFGLIANLGRLFQARRRGLDHDLRFTLTERPTLQGGAANEHERSLRTHKERLIPPYADRVRQLAEMCRRHGILSIFVTQPALYGPQIDPTTAVDLGAVQVRTNDGLTAWAILEAYNEAVLAVAEKLGVPTVDLAKTMPKDSRYYYDFLHYSDEGAKMVAEILAPAVASIIKARCGSENKSWLPRSCIPIDELNSL